MTSSESSLEASSIELEDAGGVAAVEEVIPVSGAGVVAGGVVVVVVVVVVSV